MDYHTFNNFPDDSSQLLGFGYIYESGSPPSHWTTNAKDAKLTCTPKTCGANLRQDISGACGTNQYSDYGVEKSSAASEYVPSLYSKSTYESDLGGSDENQELATERGSLPPVSNNKDNNLLTNGNPFKIQNSPSWVERPKSDNSLNSVLMSNSGNFSIFSDTEDVNDDLVASLYERENAIVDSPESDSDSTQTMGQYLYGSPIIRNPSPWYAPDSLAIMSQKVGMSPNMEFQLEEGKQNQDESVYNTTDTDSSPEYSPFSTPLAKMSKINARSPQHIGSTDTVNKPRSKRRVKHCPICNKALLRDLTRHIRTHSKESGIWCPFPRELCNHKRGIFNRRYEYKKHLITAHFECDNKQAARDATWLNDKLELSGKCVCGNSFSSVKHWISHHIEARECPLLANTREGFDHLSHDFFSHDVN